MRSGAFLNDLGNGFLLDCAPKVPLVGLSPAAKDSAEADQRECLANVLKPKRDAFVREKWNALRIAVAYARAIEFAESRLSDRVDRGGRAWGVISMPLGTAVQMLGYGDWSHAPKSTVQGKFSALGYGGRANIGSPAFNAYFELTGESRYDRGVNVKQHMSAWSGGVEFRASDGLWISTGFGEQGGEATEPAKTVVLARIKWGVADKARYAP